MSVMILELKASYEPVQGAAGFSQAASNRPVSQAKDKNGSFNRVLAKVNQRSQQSAKQGFDQESNAQISEEQSIQSEPSRTAVPKADSDQPDHTNQIEADSNLILLVQMSTPAQTDQPAQNNSNTAESATAAAGPVLSQPGAQLAGGMLSTDVSVLQAETIPAIQTDAPIEAPKATVQPVPLTLIESALQFSADSGQNAAAANMNTTQTSPDGQVQGQSLPDAAILTDINAAAAPAENEQSLPILPSNSENQTQPTIAKAENELTSSRTVPAEIVLTDDAGQAAVQNQLPVNNALQEAPQSAETQAALTAAEPNVQQTRTTANGDLQSDADAAVQPATGETEAAADGNQTDPVAAVILKADNTSQENPDESTVVSIQQDGTAARVQIKEKISIKIKSTESADDTAADDAEPADSQAKSISKEDIRFKMMEKVILNKNQKTGKDQPAADIKKIMVSENQRLTNTKTVSEEAGSTDTASLSTSSQTDALTIGTGFEKSMITARAENTPPTVSTHAAAQNVDAQEIIDQIVQKAELLKSENNNTEMRIQLKPGFLGKMVIKVAIEDGLVTAKFVTESQHVKQLLEANLVTLKQNLEAQGLKVDRTEVNVQLDNGGNFHGDESGRELMWKEMRDGSNQNRSSWQGFEQYQQGDDAGLDSLPEPILESSGNYVQDGRVDFMI